MTQAIVTTTTDHDALQCLLSGPVTRETTAVQLAREWGWNRMKVSRRLRQWEDEGRIARRLSREGISTITILAANVHVDVHPPAITLESQAVTPPRRLFTVQR